MTSICLPPGCAERLTTLNIRDDCYNTVISMKTRLIHLLRLCFWDANDRGELAATGNDRKLPTASWAGGRGVALSWLTPGQSSLPQRVRVDGQIGYRAHGAEDGTWNSWSGEMQHMTWVELREQHGGEENKVEYILIILVYLSPICIPSKTIFTTP